MSEITKGKKLQQRTEALRTLAALALFTKDSYSNPGAKLGAGQPNLMNMAQYPIERITRDWQLMTSLYRNDWICKRIIDTPAEDMTRAWVKINSQLDPDLLKRFDYVIKQQHVRDRIQSALKWARLYGGSGAVIMIRGHEDIMDQPLDMDTIMPGSFGGLIVLDRWDGISPTGELVEELGDPEFGRPAYYNIGGQAFNGISMRVHYSRVLPFLGRELPVTEEVGENYWGASEMEHIFEELNKRNTSSANIAQLLFQANLRVLKTGDLAEQLATLDPEAMKEIYQVAQAQNELMSSFGLQFLDSGDSFETHQYTFAGISDVYKTFMSDISGAAEIPATKLFGRSPEGMNSTGESDLTNYYDAINAKQERILRPALEKLFQVICVSTFGAMPDDFDFEFNSVRSSSEAERADLAKNIVDSVLAAFNSDIVDKATVLQELRKSSAATGLFSSITDEQIDAAKQEALMAAQQPQVPSAQAIGVQTGQGQPVGEAQMQQPAMPQAPMQSAMMVQDSFSLDWSESMVNRMPNGQFGPKEGPDKGGGSGGGSPAKSSTESAKSEKHTSKDVRKYFSGNPRENVNMTNRHVHDSEAYKKYNAECMAKGMPRPSFFTAKMQSIRDKAAYKLKNGDFIDGHGRYDTPCAIIDLEKPIGMAYNMVTRKMEKTRFVRADVSFVDGTYHLMPVYREEGGR